MSSSRARSILWLLWAFLMAICALPLLAAVAFAQNGPPSHANKGGVPSLQVQVAALNGQITTLQGQVTTLQGQVATLQSELDTAETENAALAGLVATLQNELVARNGEIASLQSQLAALQTQALVPQTGQTNSYAAGDDGAIRAGVALPTPRFTDNSDGTVTDNLTGLIWLKNANCFGNQRFGNAIHAANSLASGSCGLADGSAVGDWRLPNVRELFSLVDHARVNPALPNGVFSNAAATFYWTSTAAAGGPTNHAWCAITGDGAIGVCSHPSAIRVWPVRGGQ